MHDSFNLGWKLAAVVRGQSAPEILHSYAGERRAIAEELLAFDRELATMFSEHEARDTEESGDGQGATKLQEYMVKADAYVSGTLTHYKPSRIVAESPHQHLARGFELGKRFHSSPVVRLPDARPLHLGHVLEADGRWRIIAFSNPEDPADRSSAIWRLAEWLDTAAESPIGKYTPPEDDVDSVIELLAVFQQGYRELDMQRVHPFLAPAKGVYGLRDYNKLFCPDLDKNDDIFAERGIDREGCIVIVRPDQHVAQILPLDGLDDIGKFFDGFMLPRE